jgi:hypothetical protein
MDPNALVDFVCAPDNRKYLYAAAGLAVPVIASILANTRNHLPAWLETALDTLALNFIHKGQK